VSRRVTLPAADDLFRSTADTGDDTAAPTGSKAPKKAPVRAVPDAPEEPMGEKRPSGRIRHDEKMTVYVTSEELMEIEQVRLQLRGRMGLAVDRGRLVREAVSLVLADVEAHGEDSALVRRLRGE
jgi:hypothetical protein